MPRPSFPRAPGSRSETLLKFALTILVVAALSGCDRVRDAFHVDNAFYFDQELQGVEGADAEDAAVKAERKPINLDTFRFPEDDTGDTAYKLAVRGRPSAGGGASMPPQKADRNRLLEFLIRRSDAVCREHTNAIVADAAFENTLFSGLTTLLGGTAAIVTGATAARVLGGTAAMSSGMQSNINLEVYRDQFAGLIVSAINKARADFKLGFIDKGMSESMDDYSLDHGITDVATYHEKCSFSSGIAEVTKAIVRPTFTAGKLDTALKTLTDARKVLVEGIDATLLKLAAANITPEQGDAWQAELTQSRARLRVLDGDILAKQAIRASLTQ